MTPAQTAALARQTAGNESTPASYSGHPVVASPEEQVITKQLTWIIRTLRKPGVRPGERECLLLSAGQILIDFLVRERAGGIA